MDKREFRDRIIKTFVEGFLCVLLPDIGLIVNQIINDREIWWTILLPFVASALAGGVSAVLNSMPKHSEVVIVEEEPLDVGE